MVHGKKVNIMVREHIRHQVVLSMMESGSKESIMGLGHLYGLMDHFIRENGEIVGKMGRGSL